MAAGGPAGKTRATRWGIGTGRPAASLTVAARAARGTSAAADSPAISVRRLSITQSTATIPLLALMTPQPGSPRRALHCVGGLVRDRGGAGLPADVDSDMSGGCPLFQFNDLTFELIVGAELHESHLSFLARCETVISQDILSGRRENELRKA